MDRLLTPARANFWCHVFNGAFFQFAAALANPQVVLPVLVTEALGASETTWGLMTAVAGAGYVAPLLLAPRLEAARRKRRLIVLFGLGLRSPYLLIMLCVMLLAASSPTLCLAGIVFAMFAGRVCMSLSGGPWTDVIAETIPHEKLGLLLGLRQGGGGLLSLSAGAISAALLAAFAFPRNYAAVYLCAYAFAMLSWAFLTSVDEVPEHVEPEERKLVLRYYRYMVPELFRDRNYRMFLIYWGISFFGLIIVPYYSVAATKYMGLTPETGAGLLITALVLGRVFGSIVFPLVARQVGHKVVIGIGVGCQALAGVVAVVAPTGEWFIAVVFLAMLGFSTRQTSGTALRVQLAPRGKRVGYATLSTILLAPVSIVAAPAAGFIMQRFGHPLLFALAAGILLCGLIPVALCNPSRPSAPAEQVPPTG